MLFKNPFPPSVPFGLITAIGGALLGANLSALNSYAADTVLYAVVVMFALLSTLLMMQAPSIATGLLSGSAGGIGFSGIKGLTQAPTGKLASSAASGAGKLGGKATLAGAKGTGRAIGGTYSGIKSGYKGQEADGKARSWAGAKAYSAGRKIGEHFRK